MNVLLLGGSGFVGSRIAHRLSARGVRVVVPTRRRERAKHVILLPTVEAVEADVHNPDTLRRLCAGQDAVINLVGILQSRRGKPYGADFARAHVELPKNIVAACRHNGVRRILHVSALKAATDAPSMYLRSKADGEAAIRAAAPGIAATILQPSVIFGPGDSFLNLFAGLARRLPVLPLAGPQARFQPVYVEDVAQVVAEALDNECSFGKTYELCGPTVYTLRQLVDYAGRLGGCQPRIIGLSPGLSYLQASMMEWLPGAPISRDNVDSMRVDNVCSGCALPFGLLPTTLESVAPDYIARRVPRSAYNAMRERARR